MENDVSLADLLEKYMQERNLGDARLATLVNEMVQRPEFLHRSTVRNWRIGTSKTVKDWRQLVSIASALRLDEVAADQLLLVSGGGSIRDLRKTAKEDELDFFAAWPEKTAEQIAGQTIVADVEERVEPVTETPPVAAAGLPSSFRVAAISALTALAVIIALGFIWNRPATRVADPLPTATVEIVSISDNQGTEGVTAEPPEAHIPVADLESPIIIYEDDLSFGWGWQERSSMTEAEVQSNKVVYAGEFSLCVTIEEYGAFALSPSDPLPVTPDQHLEFQIHGTESVGRELEVFINNDTGPAGEDLIRLDLAGKYIEGGRVSASEWRAVSIPLRELGLDGELITTLTEIDIHAQHAGENPTFFLDDIRIVDAEHATEIVSEASMDSEEVLDKRVIFTDKMHPLWSWSDSSWNATIDGMNSEHAFSDESASDEFAIKVELNEFGGIAFFTHPPIAVEPDLWIEFQILGAEPGGQQLVFFVDNDFDFDNGSSDRLQVNNSAYIDGGGDIDGATWRQVRVPLADLEIDGDAVKEVSLIMIHSNIQGETPTFWLDDVRVVSGL